MGACRGCLMNNFRRFHHFRHFRHFRHFHQEPSQ